MATIEDITSLINAIDIYARPNAIDLSEAASQANALLQHLNAGNGLSGSLDQEAALEERQNQQTAAGGQAEDDDVPMEDADVQRAEMPEDSRHSAPDNSGELLNVAEASQSQPIVEYGRTKAKKRNETYNETADNGEPMGDFEGRGYQPSEYFDVGDGGSIHSKIYLKSRGWQKRIYDLHDIEPMDRPAGMVEDPHPWQSKGAAQIDYLCRSSPSKGGLVGDDMGLGKTLLAVEVMWRCKDEPGVSLVVAPKSVNDQWVETIESAFTGADAMRALKLDNPKYTVHQILAEGYDVLVVSYEFVETRLRQMEHHAHCLDEYVKGGLVGTMPRKPYSMLHSKLWRDLGLPFKRVVIDEAQNVNKHDLKKHIALKALYVDSFVLLSGTLAHNKWHDFAGILDFIQGHPLDTRGKFMSLFASKLFDENNDERLDAGGMALLQKFLQPMLIARPSSVLKLPDLFRKAIFFNLLGNEDHAVAHALANYKKAVKASKKSAQDPTKKIPSPFGLLVAAVMTSLHPLLAETFNIDPKMFDGDEDDPAAAWNDRTTIQERNNPKTREEWLKRVRERENLIKESGRLMTFLNLYRHLRDAYPDEKIVIFSQYRRWLDIIAEALKRTFDIDALRFDGSVSDSGRARVRQQFDDGDASIPLLMTAGAGSVGLNITTASIVIQTEPWWNGNVEKQSVTRVWRQRQTRDVKWLQMLALNGGMDMHILKGQKMKTEEIAALMGPLIHRHDEPPAEIELLGTMPEEPYQFDEF